MCLELITSTKDEEKIRKVFEEDEKRILSVLNDMEALLAENKVIFHDSLDSLCLKEFTVYISFEQEQNPIKLTLFHKTYTLITQYFSWYSPLQISGDVVRLGGQPETSILAKAEEVQAAMIVMGSRGLGTIRRTILGSVSEYVLHHSHVPVMICKIKS